MSITDNKIHPRAKVGWEAIRLALGATAINQAAKLVDSIVPGFAFEVMQVEVNALTVAAALSVDVQIGGVTCLAGAIVPVAATPTRGVLAATVAAKRGTALEAIQAKYTSDGTGAATNAFVTVWIRPIPGDGEVYAV